MARPAEAERAGKFGGVRGQDGSTRGVWSRRVGVRFSVAPSQDGVTQAVLGVGLHPFEYTGSIPGAVFVRSAPPDRAPKSISKADADDKGKICQLANILPL